MAKKVLISTLIFSLTVGHVWAKSLKDGIPIKSNSPASSITKGVATQPHTPILQFSKREQAARIIDIQRSSLSFGEKPPSSMSYYQRNYTRDWDKYTTHQRVMKAESIGNQGRGMYAEKKGWIKKIGSQRRGIPQGPDSIYWDPYSGKVRSLETKGGTSKLRYSYQTKQGTNANTVSSAEYVLNSSKSTPAERSAAAYTIEAARRKRLTTNAVSTPHREGKAGTPKIMSDWDKEDVSRQAQRAKNRSIRKNPQNAELFDQQRKILNREILKNTAIKGVSILGVVAAIDLGRNAYTETQKAIAMFDDPFVTNTPEHFLTMGLAMGKWGESATLGLGSSALWVGKSKFKTFGNKAGHWFLPIAIGVETIDFSLTAYHFNQGTINQREFYIRSTGPAIFVITTVTGTVIGCYFGSPKTGALIGSLVAIPLQYAADLALNSYYREYDEEQIQILNASVERYYEINQ